MKNTVMVVNGRKELAWSLALGILAFGCGEDKSDGGDTTGGDDMGGASETGAKYTSGVNGATMLSAVSDAEARKLCEFFETRNVAPTPEQTCTFTGLLSASTEAECEQVKLECLADEDGEEVEEVEEVDPCAYASASEFPRDCSASVAELEACFLVSVLMSQVANESASCSDAGEASSDDAGPLRWHATRAECVVIESKCPGFFEDEDGEFSCDNGTSSYDEIDRCDDIPDCVDGSDEKDC